MTDVPIPVAVTNPEPLPVVVVHPHGEIDAPPNTTAEQDRQTAGERLAAQTAAPTTTAEEDRKTAGQREINRKWEDTQASIALWVIRIALLVASVLALCGRWLGVPEIQLAAIVFLFGVANLVTGFYFGRTNHQRSGGVGGDTAGAR